jgi:predicted flap endonuclease-1-like 5' DNA nuclease
MLKVAFGITKKFQKAASGQIEQFLNAAGVYRFLQISSLSFWQLSDSH